MKRILLLSLFIPFLGFSQTTRVSTQDGNFLNPLIWSPIGIPASGDSIVIDHDVVMNSNIYYTAGTIYIRSGGELIEDATDRTLWADGTGSVTNEGTFTTHLLLISPAAKFTNSGNFINIDSLWNQGTVTNTNSGNATLFDFWNDQGSTFTNDGVLSNADSLLNQGVFTNNVDATVYDILNDEMATFTNTGNIQIQNNMNNQGYATNDQTMVIHNDFSNCNLQTLDAIFENNGQFCIVNDFSNCIDDSLIGTGDYYIGGSSSNFGVFDGSFNFYTPSGTLGITGNIQPGITVAQGSCNLGVSETKDNTILVYPNPVTDLLNVSINNVSYDVYDLSGRVMLTGTVTQNTIDVSSLNKGMYTVVIDNNSVERLIKH